MTHAFVSAGAAVLMAGGNSLGPFPSTGNYFDTTGATAFENFVASSTLVWDFEVNGWSSGEDLLCFNDANSGWFFNCANGALAIFFRGAGGGFWTITGNILAARHRLVLWRTSGGALRFSLDGSAAAQLVASPTYTTALSTAKFAVGRNTGENTRSAVNMKCLGFAWLNRAPVDDAEAVAWANERNSVNRHVLPTTVTGDANLRAAFRASDYSGTGAWTNVLGSQSYTLAKTGTPAKNTIPQYQRTFLDQTKWLDNELFDSYATPAPHYAQTYLSNCKFTATTTDCIVEAICTQGTSFTNQLDIGVDVDGTQVQVQRNNAGSGLEIFPVDLIVMADLPTMASASHTITLTNSMQSKVATNPRTGLFAQAVWLPVGVTASFTGYSAPTKRAVVLGDSITMQLSDTANAHTCTTESWTARLRAARTANWRIHVKAWGGRMWADDILTSGGRQALANQIAALLDGTSVNVVLINLGHNDHVLGGYVNIATFESDLTDFLSRLKTATAAKPGIVIRLITPLYGSADATINGGGAGFTMAQMRTAQSNAMAANSLTAVSDGTTATSGATAVNDGVHLKVGTPGHIEMFNFVAALPEMAA